MGNERILRNIHTLANEILSSRRDQGTIYNHHIHELSLQLFNKYVINGTASPNVTNKTNIASMMGSVGRNKLVYALLPVISSMDTMVTDPQ